jgi:hypothetical protein
MPARSASAPFDPTLPPTKAAAYLGCSTRQLRRMKLKRTPIPSRGSKRPAFGYLLSTLNACRDALENPRSRVPRERAS